MKPKILIVDDEPNMVRSLQITLEEEDRCRVVTATTGEEATALLDPDLDLVITDLTMPDMDGMEVLRRTKERAPDAQVVIMTAYSTVRSAIDAIRAGAYEYLLKPFDNEAFLMVVENALKVNALTRENRALQERLERMVKLDRLIGQSEPMQRIYFLVTRAAEADTTVLITGESGTGKELIARAIHMEGTRRKGPFVAINCTALGENLLESELFGHERGAFTGAIKTKIGKFQQAHGGTLFLDEVGDMSAALQSKLLRVLQDKTFERVGGNEPIQVDVRIIAATNKSLEKAIAEGRFREDLYYRLNVISIHSPPLRERREDIPILLDHYLAEKGKELNRTCTFSPEARTLLCAYDYPGNVRELVNIVERAMVLARRDIIEPGDLPIQPAPGGRLNIDTLIADLENSWEKLQHIHKELERQLLERAVREHAELSNEEIAVLLGTSRRILELRLQEFGIQKQQVKKGPPDAAPPANERNPADLPRGTSAATGSMR
jgi:DNA-binding NtrC family response regulator